MNTTAESRMQRQEIFDKIDVNSGALSVYYAVGKYRPVQSFGFSRVRVDSIAGVNIWRKYSFATILFCRSFDLVLSRFLSIPTTVGNGNWWDVCEIIFRRARSSTLSEISDEWKRGFLSRLFSLPFFFFSFLFYPGAGLRPGLNPRTLEKSMLRLSIFRSTKRGNIDDVLRARGRISIALGLLHLGFLNSHDVI